MFFCTFAKIIIDIAFIFLLSFKLNFKEKTKNFVTIIFDKDKNMSIIQIKDRKFSMSIPEVEIQAAVRRVAEDINCDMADKNPLFICVLNGSFMFAGDLMKTINFPCEITFIKLSSYDGLYTSGTVKEIIGLNESVVGRTVVVVEDIVDTGITMERILESLRAKGASEIKVATFLQKPEAMQRDITVDYVAMKIPNDFIVGYGLDYDGYGRNLKDIYTVIG